jgi:hypothetical protein
MYLTLDRAQVAYVAINHYCLSRAGCLVVPCRIDPPWARRTLRSRRSRQQDRPVNARHSLGASSVRSCPQRGPGTDRVRSPLALLLSNLAGYLRRR